MSRLVGYFLLLVAALVAVLVAVRISVLFQLAESGFHRGGMVMEVLFLAICGVVLPIGLSALLLKKRE